MKLGSRPLGCGKRSTTACSLSHTTWISVEIPNRTQYQANLRTITYIHLLWIPNLPKLAFRNLFRISFFFPPQFYNVLYNIL
jgi:hypothetical protein